ncbi:MAG: serine/threonine-protein kinase [Polyangiaceae bacterium]
MTGQNDAIAPGTVVAGRYRIERRLGQGGMGSVYEVEHQVTGQRLALKLLDPKLTTDAIALERFRRESRAPARIDSDHVVKVTDADVAPELDGAPFLVMELLRGESFDELLKRRGRLEPDEALTYLRQIGRALDRAHALGIIHRDIKPENLILTRRDDGSPCVKLLDFGIAKLTEGGSMQSKTATGEVFGTPLYMSPEQTLGRVDRISPQTDVWALGIIAHRLLLGAEPWTAETLPHLVAQIAYEPLPVPSDRGSVLGPAFDAWFKKCCARETTDRFSSAGNAIRELGHALGVRDLASSSQHAILIPDRDSDPRSSSALAATAVATSPSAIGTDTLTAQVAPGKPSSKVFVAAILGAVVVIAGSRLLLRSSADEGTTNAASSQELPTTTAPALSAQPSSEPQVAPAEDASTPAPPSASSVAAPAAPKPLPAPVAAPKPQPNPVGPKPTPAPTPKPTPAPVATPAPAPSPPPDPLSGRH